MLLARILFILIMFKLMRISLDFNCIPTGIFNCNDIEEYAIWGALLRQTVLLIIRVGSELHHVVCPRNIEKFEISHGRSNSEQSTHFYDTIFLV